MNRIATRTAPEFWWLRRSLAAYALAPLGAAYGRAAARRMMAPGVSVDLPVICVGNLVVGGAGKTPTAVALAAICKKLNLRPGFLLRGYGGTERGPLVVNRSVHRAAEVGDEALLLARHAMTVVAADRPAGARLLSRLGVDLIVMDDGLQNPSLKKDLSLVVVDAARGVGNGFVFPAGPLRAPLAAQIRRTDALVVLGTGPGGPAVRLAARAGLPILRGHIEPLRRRGLRRTAYLAFAGIADPEKFYAALRGAGAEVAETRDFPDHHLFTEAECEAILADAARLDLTPITTEKDMMRLLGRTGAAERLSTAAETFPVRTRFEEPRRIAALIMDTVTGFDGAYRRGFARNDNSRSSDAAASA